MIEVRAHGRVNLIGDHTDYTGGWVLPMLVDEHTTISGDFVDEPHWTLNSDDDPDPIDLSLPVTDPAAVVPSWGRYVAGVLHEITRSGRPLRGFRGRVTTDVPIGSGLSSSAALEVAVARVAFHDDPITDVELARLCQRAEHLASGVPCGIMDQLCIASGRPNHATLIDCTNLTVENCPMPSSIHVTYEFVAPRRLSGSEYATRVAEAERATALLGPLRDASLEDVQSLDDPVLRRRARHIVTENRRVLAFAEAMRADDVHTMGALMTESHRSLQHDYETSTEIMDAAVERLLTRPDVLGARMTGGGFGGCVVALRRADY